MEGGLVEPVGEEWSQFPHLAQLSLQCGVRDEQESRDDVSTVAEHVTKVIECPIWMRRYHCTTPFRPNELGVEMREKICQQLKCGQDTLVYPSYKE